MEKAGRTRWLGRRPKAWCCYEPLLIIQWVVVKVNRQVVGILVLLGENLLKDINQKKNKKSNALLLRGESNDSDSQDLT